MRRVLALALVATTAAAATACGATKERTLTASCADSTYQWPAHAHVKTFAPLRVGPVAFQGWQPRSGVVRSPGFVLRPTKREQYYKAISWFDIADTATGGVTISVAAPAKLLWQGTHPARGLTFLRAIRFPLCRDIETMRLEGTQYGLSVVLPRPGCFTIEVRRAGAGAAQAARATVHVLRRRC